MLSSPPAPSTFLSAEIPTWCGSLPIAPELSGIAVGSEFGKGRMLNGLPIDSHSRGRKRSYAQAEGGMQLQVRLRRALVLTVRSVNRLHRSRRSSARCEQFMGIPVGDHARAGCVPRLATCYGGRGAVIAVTRPSDDGIARMSPWLRREIRPRHSCTAGGSSARPYSASNKRSHSTLSTTLLVANTASRWNTLL